MNLRLFESVWNLDATQKAHDKKNVQVNTAITRVWYKKNELNEKRK